MKVLLISASPRYKASKTLALAKIALKGSNLAGADIEVVSLRNYKIGFCRHCESCHRRILQCPIKDDAMMLAGKILDADGIIFACPNYINQVPGPLKTLFDRHSHFIHCKRLLGKYTAAVVTSGSGYDMPVARYLKYYSNLCGAQFSGAVTSRQDRITDKSDEALLLGKKIVSDIASSRNYPGQIIRIGKGLDYFKKIISLRRAYWKEEFLYYKDMGWL
ncbi:MAG: flavodoxin family protein [Candidatus Omnitrophica bacterium]|jgi:multimeric flavodoxin WrbA|nr:flavodoxin family protein [Candidatus Omnitrophota bacterium]